MAALRRLRHGWFAPSRPLAVDDEPHWQPATDPQGELPSHDSDQDDPAPAPAT